MSQHQHIDKILRNWAYQPGVVNARLVRADDGREVLQMRVEMGVLQMETEHRPDGELPGSMETYLDHLIIRAVDEGDDFRLAEKERAEVDREFFQFYHRRICWLALREFGRAVRDADHTLALMGFVAIHSPDLGWTLSHARYRPFVLFQRTQAAALLKVEDAGPERAIETVNEGLSQIRQAFEQLDVEEQFDDDVMVGQLMKLKEWIRDHYQVGRTLSEQLADAVAREKYELAAKLRDEIARQRSQTA